MNQEARTALTVLSPAVAIAALFLLPAWRPWQRGEQLVRNGFWGGPCALGLGFLAAFFVVAGTRGVQLQDRWHWIAPIVLAAAGLGFIASFRRVKFGPDLISTFLLTIACAVLLHPPAVAGEPIYWKMGLGAAAALTLLMLEPIAKRLRLLATPPPRLPKSHGSETKELRAHLHFPGRSQ
jgi:hypothetical protein